MPLEGVALKILLIESNPATGERISTSLQEAGRSRGSEVEITVVLTGTAAEKLLRNDWFDVAIVGTTGERGDPGQIPGVALANALFNHDAIHLAVIGLARSPTTKDGFTDAGFVCVRPDAPRALATAIFDEVLQDLDEE